jgi:hypothetical protein
MTCPPRAAANDPYCGSYVASSLEIKNPKGKSAYTGIFPGWAVEPSIHL